MTQRYVNTCASYGLTYGTPEFAQCMQLQDMQFRQSMARAFAAPPPPQQINVRYCNSYGC